MRLKRSPRRVLQHRANESFQHFPAAFAKFSQNLSQHLQGSQGGGRHCPPAPLRSSSPLCLGHSGHISPGRHLPLALTWFSPCLLCHRRRQEPSLTSAVAETHVPLMGPPASFPHVAAVWLQGTPGTIRKQQEPSHHPSPPLLVGAAGGPRLCPVLPPLAPAMGSHPPMPAPARSSAGWSGLQRCIDRIAGCGTSPDSAPSNLGSFLIASTCPSRETGWGQHLPCASPAPPQAPPCKVPRANPAACAPRSHGTAPGTARPSPPPSAHGEEGKAPACGSRACSWQGSTEAGCRGCAEVLQHTRVLQARQTAAAGLQTCPCVPPLHGRALV